MLFELSMYLSRIKNIIIHDLLRLCLEPFLLQEMGSSWIEHNKRNLLGDSAIMKRNKNPQVMIVCML